MTREELFKMVKISNIKRKDIVLDNGRAVRRYTAKIEDKYIGLETDGTPCRPHLSVYEFIDGAKKTYIQQLVGGLI